MFHTTFPQVFAGRLSRQLKGVSMLFVLQNKNKNKTNSQNPSSHHKLQSSNHKSNVILQTEGYSSKNKTFANPFSKQCKHGLDNEAFLFLFLALTFTNSSRCHAVHFASQGQETHQIKGKGKHISGKATKAQLPGVQGE